MFKGSAPILEVATLVVVLLGCVVALVPDSGGFVLALVRPTGPAVDSRTSSQAVPTRSDMAQNSKRPVITVATAGQTVLSAMKLPKAKRELAPTEDWGGSIGRRLRIEPSHIDKTVRDLALANQRLEKPVEPLRVDPVADPSLDDLLPVHPTAQLDEDEWVRIESHRKSEPLDDDPQDQNNNSNPGFDGFEVEPELRLESLPRPVNIDLGLNEGMNDFVPRGGASPSIRDSTDRDRPVVHLSSLPNPLAAEPKRSAASELKDMIRRFGVGGRVVSNPTWKAESDMKPKANAPGSAPTSVGQPTHQDKKVETKFEGKHLSLPNRDSEASLSNGSDQERIIAIPGPRFRDLPPNQ